MEAAPDMPICMKRQAYDNMQAALQEQRAGLFQVGATAPCFRCKKGPGTHDTSRNSIVSL